MSEKALPSNFESVYLTKVAHKTDVHTYISNDDINACSDNPLCIGLYAYLQCTFQEKPIDYEKIVNYFTDSASKIDKNLNYLLKVGLLTKRMSSHE